jgi:hypothetical protein
MLSLMAKLEPERAAWVFPDNLALTLDKGLYGGLIGGIIGGVVIASLCRLRNPGNGSVAIQILWFARTAATMWSVCAHVFVSFFRAWSVASTPPLLFNEIRGIFLGSALGDILSGLLGGRFFGPRDEMYAEPWVLAPRIATAATCILGSIHFYSYQGTGERARRAFLTSIATAVLGFAVAIFLSWLIGLDRFFPPPEWTPSKVVYYEGGMIAGGLFASVFGLAIGIPLYLHRTSRVQTQDNRLGDWEILEWSTRQGHKHC